VFNQTQPKSLSISIEKIIRYMHQPNTWYWWFNWQCGLWFSISIFFNSHQENHQEK